MISTGSETGNKARGRAKQGKGVVMFTDSITRLSQDVCVCVCVGALYLKFLESVRIDPPAVCVSCVIKLKHKQLCVRCMMEFVVHMPADL